MNPSEAARVLSVAVTFDARLKPPSREDAQARAAAWAAALDEDLPQQSAERIVIEHYRESTEAVMPAHVNRAWRQRKREALAQEREAAERRALTESAETAVPMPESVKYALQNMVRRSVP